MRVQWFDREWMLKGQLTEHERLRNAGRLVAVVFHRDGERIRKFRRAWLSACQAASVPGRILHNFRRTAVRNLERPESHGPPRWRWSGTRPRASTGDTPSSTRGCSARLPRKSMTPWAQFRAH